MQQFDTLLAVNLPDCWLTIGSFDGVHLGHQAIVKQLVQEAHKAGLPAVVLTFFPHPSVVLRNRQDAFYLTSPEERAGYLGDLGVDIIITHPFTRELSELTAAEFMSLVHQHLHPSHLWLGYDFALGRGREGNVERLRQLGNHFNYRLNIIEPFQTEGVTVSSSQLRTALREGEVDKVMRLSCRPYQLSGAVVHGDGRGKVLGIPTANLDIWRWRALPKVGVYACNAVVEGEIYQAVTNIGVRPTFEDMPVAQRVETHILDFDQNLYGRIVKLDFIARLRDELRFPNIQALVDQIQADIHQARQVLEKHNQDEDCLEYRNRL